MFTVFKLTTAVNLSTVVDEFDCIQNQATYQYIKEKHEKNKTKQNKTKQKSI